MKKKIIGSVLVLGIVAVAAGLFVPNAVQKITKESVITSSQLEKAVDISELSTAEFIYNGIADKYSDGNLEETECHIAYASTVKVGIALDQITFTIDEEKKTVTPVLPEITVNTVTVDPDSLSFIPQNPDVELKDIMTVCKEDALKEASESKELYQKYYRSQYTFLSSYFRCLLPSQAPTYHPIPGPQIPYPLNPASPGKDRRHPSLPEFLQTMTVHQWTRYNSIR